MNRDQVDDALRRLNIQPMGFSGAWVQAICPFASTRHAKGTDRNPSFGVSVGDSSRYYCLACHAKGRLVDLPKDLHGITDEPYEDLTREFVIAESMGAVIRLKSYETYEELKPLEETIYGDMFTDLTPEASAYAASRNLPTETLDRIGVRDWPEDGRLMFPVRDFKGRLFGWAGRSYIPEVKAKVWNLKGMDKACQLLGSEHCTCARPIVLVEGLMFYARLHDLQIQEELNMDVVAIMGSAVSFEQADLLAQVDQPVILFLDNDKAGRDGTWGTEKKARATGEITRTEGAVHLLSRAIPVLTVTYPTGVEDPDNLGEETIYQMLENAKPYSRKRVRSGG